MKTRTTWILAVIALVVAGVVALDYKKGTTTEKRRERSRRLVELDSASVTRLELVQSNVTMVAEKSGDRWQLKQPLEYRADAGTIHSILDGIEFAEKIRTLTAADLAGMDLAELGLAPPRIQLTLTARDKPVTLRVGGETPTKNSVYVQVAGREEVCVVESYLVERLQRTVADFRDRVVLDFDPALASRLELKSADRVVELARQAAGDGPALWSFVRPLAARADQTRVSDLLSGLAALRVQEFVSDDPKDIHTYRLGEPAREITVSRTGTEGVLTLLVSAPLTNQPHLVHAKLKNGDAIFTLEAAAVQKSDVAVADLRDRQVLAARAEEVQAIEIQRGADRLTLVRSNEEWRITGPVTEPAAGERVEGLLTNLRGLRVEQFAADVATDLEKFGLAVPATIVKLQGAGTNVVGQLLISAPEPGAAVCHVKREGEPFIYGVATNIWGWLPADHWAVRSRRVANFGEAPITKLEVQRPTGRVVVNRAADGSWRLGEPAQGVLNVDDVQVVVDVLARLDAAEFHATASAALAQPTHTFVMTAGDKTCTLTLAGQEAAWTEPPLYFTLPAETVQTLTKELVSAPAAN